MLSASISSKDKTTLHFLVMKPQMSRSLLLGISPSSEEDVTYLAVYWALINEGWRIFKNCCNGWRTKAF